MKIVVRPIMENDFAELARLRVRLYGEIPPEINEKEIEELFEQSETNQVFFVEDLKARRVAGFLEARLRDYAEGCETSPVGYIEGWFVYENYRQKGVGRMLIEAAENWARGKGCREMASDCELENEVSLTAHARLGYQESFRLIHFRKPLFVR